MNLNKENDYEPSGEFAASIRDFRSAVTHIADHETARPVSDDWLAPARKRRQSAQQRTVLGWACAALLCFAMMPFPAPSHPPLVAHQATPAVATPAADSDTALLEQVDTNVSESVPSSLAPLAELDSWNAQATNTSSDSSVNRTTLNSTERTK